MTNHSKKDIVKSLQLRFPKLAERIERSAAVIEDMYKLVRRSTVESYERDKRAIMTLATSGALPGTIAKFFITQLVDPDEKEEPLKYPRVVIEMPSSKELLDWLALLRKKGRTHTADELAESWQAQYGKWKRGEWGRPEWSNEGAYRRAGAWARGNYHYKRGEVKVEALSEMLKDDPDFKKFKNMDASKKRAFVEQIRDRERQSLFSQYMKAGRVMGRGLNLKQAVDLGEPTPSGGGGGDGGGDGGGGDGGGFREGFFLSTAVYPPETGIIAPHGKLGPLKPGTMQKVQFTPHEAWRFSHFVDNDTPRGATSAVTQGNKTTYILEVVMDDDHNVTAVCKQPPPRLECRIEESTHAPKVGEVVDFAAVVVGGVPPYKYDWDFGDGTGSTEQTVQHPYNTPGKFTVTLIVSDSAGSEASATAVKDVGEGPPPPAAHVCRNVAQSVGISEDMYQIIYKITELYYKSGIGAPSALKEIPSDNKLRIIRRTQRVTDEAIQQVVACLYRAFAMGQKYAGAMTAAERAARNIPGVSTAAKGVGKVARGAVEVTAEKVLGRKATRGPEQAAMRELEKDARKYYNDHQEAEIRQELLDAITAWKSALTGTAQRLRAEGAADAASSLEHMASLSSETNDPGETAVDRAIRGAKSAAVELVGEAQLKAAYDAFADARKKFENLPEVFKSGLEEYLERKVASVAAKHKVEEKLLEGVVADLVDYYDRIFKAGTERWYHRVMLNWNLGGHVSGQMGTGMGYILKEWWGVWVWGLFAGAGMGGSIGLLFLIIWAFLKIPLFTGIAVAWFQIAFLAGGTVLGFLQVPQYVPIGQSGLVALAFAGGLANMLINMKSKVDIGALFEGTDFGTIVRQIQHFVAGGMVVLAIEMLMLGLGFELPSFVAVIAFLAITILFSILGFPPQYMPFFVILLGAGMTIGGSALGFSGGLDFALFLIFLMLGLTDFYPAGGIKGVSLICIGLLVFGYFAMGPYSAYVHETVDQVKEPMRVAWSVMRESFTGVWLLLTNPTEYYARQQLVSARSERPLSWPAGVELSTITVVPEGTVPAGTDFTLFLIAQNKGDFVANKVQPIPWCKPAAAALAGLKCEGPLNAGGINILAGIGAPELDSLAAPAMNAASAAITTLGTDYAPATLRPIESRRWSFDFTAVNRNESWRTAETVFNKIPIYLTYTANTSTSLQVELATSEEIDRRARAGETVFRPVVSVAKSAPAQISLNVGPQPLEANKPAKLIVAVSNTRPDGNVTLTTSTAIDVQLSESVGTNLNCPSKNNIISTKVSGKEEYIIKLNGQHSIAPYEFQSIFAVICTFTAANTPALQASGSLTGLVTAKLSDYMFVLQQEKSITVGPPLGIIAPSTAGAPDVTK